MLFIGTEFSILYSSMYPPAGAACWRRRPARLASALRSPRAGSRRGKECGVWAPLSASITESGEHARTAGAPPSATASIIARGAGARGVGVPASASKEQVQGLQATQG
jgi:hypothetical protein